MSEYTVAQAMNDAIAHHQAGRFREAEDLYRRVLGVLPNHPDALHLLGLIAHEVGQQAAAEELISKAIAIEPRQAAYYCSLGEVLRVTGRIDQAAVLYRKALELFPEFPEAQLNLGIVHAHRCEMDDAIKCFERAIELKPGLAEAHDGLGLALLAMGDLQRGWREQEWRWKKRKFPSRKREFAQPLWDGSELGGRSILIHTEQGFGDAIQFCRYVPMVGRRGGRVILECPAELRELFGTLEGVGQIVENEQALPAFDVHCPVMSLPMVMGTTLETIPGDTGYVRAEAAKVERWKLRITGEGLKVGIVWAGSAVHTNDLNRSATLADFAPLGKVPGIQWYSLQMGQPAQQLDKKPDRMNLIDLTSELGSFVDTAAMVSCLDLVISVDTAVVHLAGALGRPVWTLLAYMPDWRWLLNRSDTPWYPTMRLFRQKSRGDWKSIMESVAGELAGIAKEKEGGETLPLR